MSAGTKESLHEWVDSLSDAEAEALQRVAENQRLTDLDDEALTPQGLQGIRRGVADVRAGRTVTLEEYRRKRGL